MILPLPCLSDNYAYLICDPSTQCAAVIDPGDHQPVQTVLEKGKWKLSFILLTHHHADHVVGAEELRRIYSSPVITSAQEAERLSFVDRTVAQGEQIELGSCLFRAIETPGHTRGHLCYFLEKEHALFSGDALFLQGCGRLFEGDAATLFRSLNKLKALPDETAIYCGHEYSVQNSAFALSLEPDNPTLLQHDRILRDQLKKNGTTMPGTLSKEKQVNPFLRCEDSAFQQQFQNGFSDPISLLHHLRLKKDRY